MNFFQQLGELFSNVTNIELSHVAMWIIGGLLIYLAIKKDMEPTLLLPMGFGAILVNLPIAVEGTGVQHVLDTLFSIGIEGAELFPLTFVPFLISVSRWQCWL